MNLPPINLYNVGEKHDQDKPDWTLLPFASLIPIIRVLEYGARKYNRDNWQFVKNPGRRYLSAAFRHLSAYTDGERLDSESGLSHIAHAACCLLFLLWFGDRDHDDIT